jgi:hypothetical protein
MTEEQNSFPENVVSLIDFKNKKLEKEKLKQLEKEMAEDEFEEFDPSSIESVNLLCSDTTNELFDYLVNNFELDVVKKENMNELILFLESYKSLIFKSVEQWHPFQELAGKIFDGVKLEDDGDGFKYIFENVEKI